MGLDEIHLWQQACQGDKKAIVEIYNRCYPAIYNYVFYRVGDRAQAEDLTGEVFVRMVDKLSTFTPNGRPILAWLYTIAYHLIVDEHRKGAQIPVTGLEMVLLQDPADSTDGQVENRLTQDKLVEALSHLSEIQRQVILMKFVQRRSNAEIASVIGKEEGAVKSIQHRALEALRNALGEMQAYEPGP